MRRRSAILTAAAILSVGNELPQRALDLSPEELSDAEDVARLVPLGDIYSQLRNPSLSIKELLAAAREPRR